MLTHVTDEQRRQPGCSGGVLDQSLDWRALTRQGRAPVQGLPPLRSRWSLPSSRTSRNQTGQVVAAHFFADLPKTSSVRD